MIYHKETPFDQLSFECLLLLENKLRNDIPDFLGFETRKQVVSAIKTKCMIYPHRYFKFESYKIPD